MKRLLWGLVILMLMAGCTDATQVSSSESDMVAEPSPDTIHASVISETGAELLQYPGREDFLDAMGHEGAEPDYTYYDPQGNLQLELYYSKETGAGYGIEYNRHMDNTYICGFAFSVAESGIWQPMDPYSPKNPTGKDGSDSDLIEGYKEILTYNEDGKLLTFLSRGNDITGRQIPNPVSMIKIEFTYREDGTLCQRKYGHDSSYFPTTDMYRNSWYDAAERVVYEDRYVSHGSNHFYYFYESDTDATPLYCLYIDHQSHGIWPTLIVYS